MNNRSWLYYLLNEDGTSLIVKDGLPTSTNVPTPLPETPDGWQDLLISYQRDVAKGGLTREFSFPLDFVLSGAKIIRNAFIRESVERKIFLLIQKFKLTLDDNYFYPKYHYFYRGELDMTSVKCEEDKTTVTISEGGLSDKIKAHEGTTYELGMDDAEAVTVKMDGIGLQEKHNWLIPETTINNTPHLVGAQFTTKEGIAAGFASFSVFYQGGAPDVNNSTDYIFSTSQVITGMRLFGEIKIQHPVQYILSLKSNRGKDITLIPSTTQSGDAVVTIPFDATFDTEAGEHFFLVGAQQAFADGFYKETTFSIEFASRYRTTYIKGLKLTTVIRRLVQKITGKNPDDLIDTSWLEQLNHLVLTPGDSVRGITDKVKLKTSLNNFFEFCRVVLGAGWGVENGKLIIREREYFLNAENPVHLGIPKAKPVLTRAVDLMGNLVKIGYPKKDTDDVNGKYAFNNTQTRTSPVNHPKLTKAIEFVSPYYADPYAIELLRINLDGKTTTDDSSDNDIYILNTGAAPESFTATGVDFQIVGTSSFIYVSALPDKADLFLPDTRFTVTGTVNNNAMFTVAGVIPFPSGTFAIWVKETVIPETGASATFSLTMHSLKRGSYDTILGLPNPDTIGQSIFNIEELTPLRLLWRHGRWFASIYYQFGGQMLKFQTTEKNSELITVINGVHFGEKADYPIDTNPLFLPYYMEFDTEVPINLAETLENNPSKCFSIEWDGVIYKGFLIKAGMAPNNHTPQAFKLLCTPDNDLTKLI